MLGEVSVDRLDQDPNVLKASSYNSLLGKVPEKTLDQVEPRSAGWSKMQVKASMACQPGFHLGMLVGGVVIDKEM